MFRKPFHLLTFVCIVPLLFVACTTNEALNYDDIYTRITDRSLQSGDSIPSPTSEPILTVTGLIGTSNTESGTISMDRATLESVGLVEYEVFDPFEEVTHIFRGVLMRDLVALWQIPDEATTLHITALNDYNVDVPLAHFDMYPVLFAIETDGEVMHEAKRGPAMLVYPTTWYPELQDSFNEIFWIWQIKSVDVR